MPTFNKPNDMNKVWAATGTRLPPDDNKISLGWVVEAPPYQEMNYVHYKQDSAIAHINQHGLPVWDGGTEYLGGISWTLAPNGNVYACLTTHTNTRLKKTHPCTNSCHRYSPKTHFLVDY